MGWIFTVTYLFLNHLSPGDVLPDLADYHPQIWIGVLALIGSLLTMAMHSYPVRAVQNTLIFALFGAILMSEAVHGWLGNMVMASSIFGPSLAAFLFCVANTRKFLHLRVLIIGLTLVGLYLSLRGILAFDFNISADVFIDQWPPVVEPGSLVPVVKRIRGMGLLRDPNDLSQFLLVMLSFVWLAWRKRAVIRNTFLVVLPTLLMVYAIFRTQSRGALLGLAVLVFIPLRRRLGTFGGAAIGVILITGMLASGYLSQRQGSTSTSDESAAGRIAAWGNGLQMLRSEPLFGVGFGQFSTRNTGQHGLTAHNSFVLCMSELGLVGYLLWLSLIVSTLFDLKSVSSLDPQDDDGVHLKRWAYAVRLALIVYLVTAWFLSRTYILTPYILIGMGVALVQMTRQMTGEDCSTRPRRWFPATCYMAMGTFILIYGTIRMRGLL
jgi:hypothetical protein